VVKTYRVAQKVSHYYITWHCMHASNSHSVQLLFVLYSVYFDVSDETFVWAVWNQFHMSSV